MCITANNNQLLNNQTPESCAQPCLDIVLLIVSEVSDLMNSTIKMIAVSSSTNTS